MGEAAHRSREAAREASRQPVARHANWHRRAIQDLNEIYIFLGHRSPSAAERFVDAIQATIDRLPSYPKAGRRLSDLVATGDLRSMTVHRFRTYLLLYRPGEQGIDVVRILHGARDIYHLLALDAEIDTASS